MNLNRKQLDRIAKAVKRVENLPPRDLVSDSSLLPHMQPFWARITARSSGWLSFVKQKYKDDGSLEDDTYTGSLNAYEVDHSTVTIGSKVLLFFAGYKADGSISFACRNTSPRAMFAVLVTQTGGSAGDDSTACSYTYSVTDLNGNSLGTAMSPQKRRTSIGAYVAPSAGSYGVGFTEVDGTFKLWDANEVPLVSACS